MSERASQRKKQSTVRHARAIQRDRRTRPTVAPSAPQVEARLTEVVHPATLAQVAAFHALGLRARVLTLPVMVAFVLRLVWRQLGSVSEAVRVLGGEGLRWADPLAVSPQAVSQRLRRFPARLFERVLADVLPRRHERWRARRHSPAVLALDGSTLEALLRQVGLLREAAKAPLAGRMAALLDVASRLPRRVWYEADQHAHDQRSWARAAAAVAPGTLLPFDVGFLDYARFDRLTARGVWSPTRPASATASRTARVRRADAARRDLVVRLGSRAAHRCAHPMRLIEVRHGGKWRRYLTDVTDPARLPRDDAVALYAERWRVADAFSAVKRLLGLAYFWTGAVNGVLGQAWATWLLYAALVDLTDAVAEELAVPFREVSLEMVYRGLYHFTQAHHRGEANDPARYLASKAKRLGLLKRKRPARPRLTTRGDP